MIIVANEDAEGSPTEEDENYFVSMTDMMVGILFVFIIMLMVFALNFRQLTDDTVQLTAEQQAQLSKANELAEQIAALRKQIANEITQLNRADQARNELLEAIKEKLDLVGLQVTIDKDTGVLRLAEDAIRFEPESSQLDAEAQHNVDAVARVLLDVLPTYTVCRDGDACKPSAGYVVETVFVEGHTDKTGSDSLNWQLSC